MADEIDDPELLAVMAAKPDGERRVSVQPFVAPRKLSASEAKKKVLIKCVIEQKPFTSDEALGGLEYWKDYEVSQADALAMQDKKQVVIIAGPTKEK